MYNTRELKLVRRLHLFTYVQCCIEILQSWKYLVKFCVNYTCIYIFNNTLSYLYTKFMMIMQLHAFNLMSLRKDRKEMSLGTDHTQWLFIFLFIWKADVERGTKDKRGICTSIVTYSSDQITVSVKGAFTKNSVSCWPVRNGGSHLLPQFHIPSLCLCLSSVNFVSSVCFWCYNKSNCPVFSPPSLCVPLTDNLKNTHP